MIRVLLLFAAATLALHLGAIWYPLPVNIMLHQDTISFARITFDGTEIQVAGAIQTREGTPQSANATVRHGFGSGLRVQSSGYSSQGWASPRFYGVVPRVVLTPETEVKRLGSLAFWTSATRLPVARVDWADPQKLELGLSAGPGAGNCRIIAAAFPFWVPLILFVAYPATVLISRLTRRWRRRRRRRRGECVKCGYNLTGLPEPRCPECGTSVWPGASPRS